ncbi:MAG: hypothetical protein IPM36_07215 [Lewinellaceae bacterium]|nr:hypothetical protein [Lewinellaceae bacterium]
MKNLSCSTYYLFALLFSLSALQAQTIKLDPDFGIAGKILTQISPGDDKGNAMALLPNGKIILAGNTLGSPGNVDWALAQYLPNGKLDTTFGDKGIVITDFGNADESANAIAVQPDGKIILAGYTSNPLTSRDFALARYLPNGTLDSSFGNAGRVTTDSLSGVQTAFCLLLLPNGYIVVAGSSGPAGSVGFFLAQYDTNGNLNPTFGTNGFVSKFYSDHDNIYSIALQADGKLVATGYTELFGFMSYTLFFATIRLLPNGALDNTFGSNGLVKTSFGVNTIYAASCLSIFPNGNILVGGYDLGKKVGLAMYHLRWNAGSFIWRQWQSDNLNW